MNNIGFTFDSEFCREYFLNKSRTPVTLKDSGFRLKKRFREDTEYMAPLIASVTDSENRKAFDDTFVDLLIYTGRAEHKFEHSSERHEIYDIYLKPQLGAIAIKKLEELFLPNKDTQDPRKILILGRPGIGKSVLCTKVLRDLSKDQMLRDSGKGFEHFFLFQFRHFNYEEPAENKISLKQLLSRVHPDEPIDNDKFQDILDNPDSVLLMFDGLDEFKHHETCLVDEQAVAGNGPTEEMQFATLYVKLVKGKQLSGATILTTCRPNVVGSVEHLKFNRTVEILGFTPEKVQEYICKHCAHNPDMMSKIWVHINSNPNLLALCYIPASCFIVCSLLEEWVSLDEEDSGVTLPTTSTEVYTGALRLFIFKHHPDYKGRPLTKDYLMGNTGFLDSTEETLSQLGSLAKDGIELRQLIFGPEQVQGMENCGLLHRLPDSKLSAFSYASHFCFLHLTLQELLAAREMAKMPPSELCNFISSNISDPKWHLVIQFLAGLLHGQGNEAINIFVKLLLDRLRGPVKSFGKKQEALLMIKCLYEHNNEAMVRKAASELERNSEFRGEIDFTNCQVTSVDCVAIAYFVKHLVTPVVLNIALNSLTDHGLLYLCDGLKHENCKVTGLNLARDEITDQGVTHLCNALKHENCKLAGLNLGHNKITDQGVSHLCDALKHENCKLTQLDLDGIDITDQGVSHLCDALKHENCKLAGLNLGSNAMIDQGASHLCDALKHENCNLTGLNLTFKKMTDQGVSHLCDALKHENCKLTRLDLDGIDITDQGVSHLCDALKHENCKLAGLNLGSNAMTDQGASHLCDALKHENCKLAGLNLGSNAMTDQGASHLCDASKHENCKLTGLNLTFKKMTNQGVSHLHDALEDENCKLTGLTLILSE